MEVTSPKKARHIADCLELSILLEASANKPGNVNRTSGFKNTRYEHFLASAVSIGSSFEEAALQGMRASEGEIDTGKIELGRIIREGTSNMINWQNGGNTLLGTSILLMPMAAAAGMTPAEDGVFQIPHLRKNLKLIVESTTPEDAVHLFHAIRIANPGGLGTAPELDVTDSCSEERIVEEKIPLLRIFQIASSYDAVCSEWVNNYPMTFDSAYPFLEAQVEKTGDLNIAIILTFLKILAEFPDTLIARKTTLKTAEKISVRAKHILKIGGLLTSEGRKAIGQLDRELRRSGNILNPGTTADVISATLALHLLSGHRP